MIEWIAKDWQTAWLILVTAVLIYAATHVAVRIAGLRSFSKMSATDFVLTVAMGSILAATVTSKSPSVAVGAAAIGSVLLIKGVLAALRARSGVFRRLAGNTPVMLMTDGRFHDAALRRCHVSREEVHAKLREANVWNYGQVLFVVLETTGDVSVLHRSGSDLPVSEEIFAGISGPATSAGPQP